MRQFEMSLLNRIEEGHLKKTHSVVNTFVSVLLYDDGYMCYLRHSNNRCSNILCVYTQQNALLLITEGQSNMNRGLSPREAAQARQAGIVVMGVGVGLKTDGIRNIVGEEWKLVLVNDYLALMEVALQVSILICKGNAT